MASFSFDVRISWKGDAEKGKEMERIVRASFTDEGTDDPAVQKLNEKINSLEGPDKIEHFGEASMPRTMGLYWEETRADPERGLPPMFEVFPELQFRLQVVNSDADEYQVFTYAKGKQVKSNKEEFDSWEKYDKDLYKWLAADIEEALLYDDALQYIPAKNWKDEAFCKNAVAKNALALEFVPDNYKTLDLCKTAIGQSFEASAYIPGKHLSVILSNKELCLGAVTARAKNIKYVPEEYHTQELWNAAIKNEKGIQLYEVPEKFRTAELCELAIQNSKNMTSTTYESIPEPLRTAELSLIMAEKATDEKTYSSHPDKFRWENFLKQVPEASKTPEFCKVICGKFYEALKYVPESQKTAELCSVAVQMDSSMLKYVPEALKTPELCLIAVQNDGNAFQNVPEALKTPELCLIAVQNDGNAFKYVPEALKTSELCLIAVQNNSDAFEIVPEALKTKEICLAALEDNSNLFHYVPESQRTAEICSFAVGKNGELLKCIPEALKTPEICLIAVQQRNDVIKDVPEASKTEEICLTAVKQDWSGKLLEYVPAKLKTLEICLTAVQKSSDALQFVPEALKETVKAKLKK